MEMRSEERAGFASRLPEALTCQCYLRREYRHSAVLAWETVSKVSGKMAERKEGVRLSSAVTNTK